jgi:Xaa-Pro aminopeptidase
MSGKLATDARNIPIQGFAPTRIQTVTTEEWEPGLDDRAFRVAADCTYQINDAGAEGTLKAGMVVVIVPGQTYTFSVGQNIEVM